MSRTDCRHFNGYKPCGKNEECSSSCPFLDVPQSYILVVHLEAMGAVLRATSILPALKRKFPSSHITWVTQAPSHLLLENNPFIDRVLTTKEDGLLVLSALEFDFAFAIDKSLKSAGVLRHARFDYVYGFQVDARSGAILPATPAAEELWQLGLSNKKKFFENEKAETQLMIEALELGPFRRDEYQLALSEKELVEADGRRRQWGGSGKTIIGINSGCSGVIQYKKLSIEMHRKIIDEISKNLNAEIVLLGGKEDSERNREIGEGLRVHQSPTERGLRDGLVSVEACDLVLSGDSLGMHMAIALKKWVVAWFGPTCEQEIDLYDRGVKLLSPATCRPCWKRVCHKTPLCGDLVVIDEVLKALREGENWLKKCSSSKRPLSVTYC